MNFARKGILSLNDLTLSGTKTRVGSRSEIRDLEQIISCFKRQMKAIEYGIFGRRDSYESHSALVYSMNLQYMPTKADIQ